MTALCIGRHDTDPPLPEPGLLLCRRCHANLAKDLAAIASLWVHLADVLVPGGTGGRSSGKPGSRPACNLDAADITDPRGAVHQRIVSWARVVIEDRQLAARRLDAEQAARLLAVHLDWCASQPFADELAAEIHDCAWQIRRVCGDLPDPPIGTCPDIDPRGETDTCGGPLRIDTGHQWGNQTIITVVCGRCGSAWADADLPLFLRVVAPTRRFPVPREWVADRYGLTANQLRLWIHRGHVRSYSDRQVELFDVLARIQEG